MLLACPLAVGLSRNHGNPCGKAIGSRALFWREYERERAFFLQSAAESWPDLAFFSLWSPFYFTNPHHSANPVVRISLS